MHFDAFHLPTFARPWSELGKTITTSGLLKCYGICHVSLQTISTKIGQTQISAKTSKSISMERFPSILFKVHSHRAQATWARETHPKPQHAKCFQWRQPFNAQQQPVACAIEAWVCNVNQGIHGMPQTDCQRAQGIEKRKMLTGQNWMNRERVTTDEHFPSVHRAIDIHVSGLHVRQTRFQDLTLAHAKAYGSSKEISESQFWELGPTLHTKKFGLRLVLPRACAFTSNATPWNGHNRQIWVHVYTGICIVK